MSAQPGEFPGASRGSSRSISRPTRRVPLLSPGLGVPELETLSCSSALAAPESSLARPLWRLDTPHTPHETTETARPNHRPRARYP